MTYADKFQFAHAGTTQLYTLIRQKNLSRPLWACTQNSDNGYHGALYTEQEISDHFAMGHWWEVSSKERDEPEMKFPFTFLNAVDSLCIAYARNDGYIDVFNYDEENYIERCCTVEEAKQHIVLGTWRVKSVGEQPQESAPINSKTDFIFTINGQSFADALAEAKAVSQAVEEVNMALESLHAILSDMGLAVVPKSVADDCHAFCCEDD